MLLIFDDSGFVIGSQSFPAKTNAAHKVVNIEESNAARLIGRAHISELDDIDSLIARIDAEDEQARREEQRNELKDVRDSALNAMTHDFGDGRIMQVRPSDEANIIRAIEIIESEGIESIGWVMVDNTKHDITVSELKDALRSGRLQGLAIWNEYNP